MKKTLLLLLLTLPICVSAQILNEAASWANPNFVITGTYNAAQATTPDVDATFSYDDDADGNGAPAVDFAAESPVYDLTAAAAGGETIIVLSGEYSYLLLTDVLALEYWDADAASWTAWYTFASNATNATYVSCNVSPFASSELDISGFSSTQLAGFRYRVSYSDDGGWKWGFCLSSPTLSSTVITPPPAEDVCLGAITIPVVSGACAGFTTGNNTSATDSNSDVPAPPAATCSSYAGGDIWFKLTVPSNGNLTISGGPSPGCCSFLWYEVYTGADCSTLTSLTCSSTNGNDPSAFELDLTGQTPGSTLWLRAWDSSNDNGPGEFNFCAKELVVAANDECADAVTLPMSADANCGNSISSTTLNSTTSASNNCSISEDVWFEIVATAESVTVSADNLAADGDSGLIPVSTVLMVYENCTDGNIACAFSPLTFPATIGTTYYVAASTRNVDNATAPATFDLCAFPTPQPPVNDECTAAISVTPSGGEGCENTVAGTTYFSTMSSENICAGGGNDVWYSFEATSESMIIAADNYQPTPSGGVPTTGVVGVFSGTCAAGGFTQLACVFDGTELALTVGETYYISVTCRDAGNFPIFANFDLCVRPSPPANNDCADAAILAEDNAEGAVLLENQTLAGASFSNSATPTCFAGTITSDVWFTIETDADGGLLEVSLPVTSAGSDLGFAVYMGTCGSFTEMACSPDGTAASFMDPAAIQEKGAASTRANETYYVQVFNKSATDLAPTFTVSTGGSALLPIELSSFDAEAMPRGNKVMWTTDSEVNADYVEVMSSPNGSTKWQSVGKVASLGNSSSRASYDLMDTNPYSITYYQLKAMDKDGSFELSQVITVRRDDKMGKMSLSPNPTSRDITLQAVASSEQMAQINIVSLSGQLVKTLRVNMQNGLNTINVNLDDLTSGIYLFRLSTSDGVQVEKIVKH